MENINTSIKEKTKYDSDIVIEVDGDRFGVELKAYKSSHSSDIIQKAFEHKKADYYLIISEKCEKIYNYPREARPKGFNPIIEEINENWILIYGKNPNK